MRPVILPLAIATPIAALLAIINTTPAHADGLGRTFYLEHVDNTILDVLAPSERVDFAHAICDAYSNGHDTGDIVTLMLSEGIDPTDTGVIVAASVYAFCDENAADMEAWAQGRAA